MVVHYAVEAFARKGQEGAMETETPDASLQQLQQKLEENLTLKIVSSIHKFDNFDLSDLPHLSHFGDHLVATLLSPTVTENPFLTKQFLSILNGLMLFVATNRQRVSPQVIEQIENALKSQGVMPKMCKAFVRWANQKDKTHFENFLKLYSKLFPNKPTAELIQKNILRLQRLLTSEDPIQASKGVAEVPIVVCLLTGFDNLSQHNDLLVHSMKFAQILLDSKIGGLKLGFKLLGGLLNNLHVSQYGQVMMIVEGVLSAFLTNTSSEKRFEGACLKFLGRLVRAYSVSLSPAEFQTQMNIFCEKYLNLVVLNFKNRSKKTRKAAQAVLFEMVTSYHRLDTEVLKEGRQQPVIDERSFVVCCLIAGLAGETSLAQANSVEALAFLLKGFWDALSPSLIKSLTRVILLLIKGKSSEVYTSILKFMSRLLKKSAPDSLAAELPVISEAIFEWDPEATKKASAKVKTFVSLLNKKFVG
jgi:hypothetical protein